MNIIGIDNGLDGAIVLMSGNAVLIRCVMPTLIVKRSKREYDAVDIKKILSLGPPDHAFIEKAQAMPGQGVSSMFMIGYGYGIIRGIVSAMEIPYTLVHPRTWQKEMFKDLPKTDTKAMSAIVCKRLWPKADWLATPRCRKAHSGLTDAALIAEYGRRVLGA